MHMRIPAGNYQASKCKYKNVVVKQNKYQNEYHARKFQKEKKYLNKEIKFPYVSGHKTGMTNYLLSLFSAFIVWNAVNSVVQAGHPAVKSEKRAEYRNADVGNSTHEYEVTEIGNSQYPYYKDQINPELWEDTLIWEDHRNGSDLTSSEIFKKKLGFDNEILLGKGKRPDINGETFVAEGPGCSNTEYRVSKYYVCWMDRSFTYPRFCYKKIGSSADPSFVSESGGRNSPDINDNGNFVFVASGYSNPNDGKTSIYGVTGFNSYPVSNPRIFQDKVVWQDYRNGSSEIYFKNLTTNQEMKISDGILPHINTDELVWTNKTSDKSNIFLLDFRTGEIKTVAENRGDIQYITAWENNVVWSEKKPDGVYRLFRADTSKLLNNPPVLQGIPKQIASVGKPFYLNLTATDLDNDTLTFEDDTEMFNVSNEGKIFWVPKNSEYGLHKINLKVKDNYGGMDSKDVEIYVNRPPFFINVPSYVKAKINESISENVSVFDPDGDDLTIVKSSDISGLELTKKDKLNFDLLYTGKEEDIGNHTIDLKVSDGIDETQTSMLLEVYKEAETSVENNTNQTNPINQTGNNQTVNETYIQELQDKISDLNEQLSATKKELNESKKQNTTSNQTKIETEEAFLKELENNLFNLSSELNKTKEELNLSKNSYVQAEENTSKIEENKTPITEIKIVKEEPNYLPSYLAGIGSAFAGLFGYIFIRKRLKKEEPIKSKEPELKKKPAEKMEKSKTPKYIDKNRCGICLGSFKPGMPDIYKCDCGIYYHNSCTIRVEKCPTCDNEMKKELVDSKLPKLRSQALKTIEMIEKRKK